MGDNGGTALLPRSFLRMYAVPLGLAVLSLIFVICAGAIFLRTESGSTPIQFLSSEASVAGVMSHTPSMVVFDIEGAILYPGVYTLPLGSRVDDGILAAGGFTNDADHETISRTINRAAVLSDGAKLFIPSHTDAEQNNTGGVLPEPVDGFIHLNTASQTELESLSGVGPVTASRIIDGRPYLRLEELVEKKIVGQKVFETLKNQLSL